MAEPGNTALLTSTDRARLIVCFQLWDRPGTAAERDAAAAGAIRILQARKLTWGDIIVPALPAPSAAEGDATDLAVCLRALATLTDRERRFVISLRAYRRLSPKQRAVLARIAQKVRSA
jgi:type II secretory pathway component PulF